MTSASSRGAELLSFAAGIAMASAAAIVLWPTPSPDLERYRRVRDWVQDAALAPTDAERLSDSALRGLAESVDAHSAWYGREELARLERETGGRYLGLGVSMRPPSSSGQILYPLAGSPAEAAGMLPGDRIVRVDGTEWSALGSPGLREKLAGSEPRVLEIDVTGLDGAERHVSVRPASIVEPSVSHETILDPELGVAYLAVRSFSQETARELDAALERLAARGMRALLIDLRGNQGGVLSSAVQAVSRFVPEGLIVRTRGRDRVEEHFSQPAAARWRRLPLVVLVDGVTASAAEVLAGALQDHRVAVLVGERTWGKGLVQTIHRLEDASGAVKVTTSCYELPSGRRLEHGRSPEETHGLQPDVEVLVDEETRAALHAHLDRASPPARWLDAIEAWARSEGTSLFGEAPADAALETALELFRGRRPGAHAPATDTGS